MTGICFAAAAPNKQIFTQKIQIMQICAHNLLTFTTSRCLAQMIMLEHNERRRKADHLKLFDIMLTSRGYIMKSIRFGKFVTGVLCMLLSYPGNGCAQGLSLVFIRCIRAWFYKTWLLWIVRQKKIQRLFSDCSELVAINGSVQYFVSHSGYPSSNYPA